MKRFVFVFVNHGIPMVKLQTLLLIYYIVRIREIRYLQFKTVVRSKSFIMTNVILWLSPGFQNNSNCFAGNVGGTTTRENPCEKRSLPRSHGCQGNHASIHRPAMGWTVVSGEIYWHVLLFVTRLKLKITLISSDTYQKYNHLHKQVETASSLGLQLSCTDRENWL